MQGKGIKAICRGLGLSRKVVRKAPRSGATEFRHQRARQPPPKLGAWQADLGRLLGENAARPGRERLALARVFEALRGFGHDAVRRHARARERSRASAPASASVPLSFAPGGAYQFDWSRGVVLIGGTAVAVRVAHLRLCHGRMIIVEAVREAVQLPPRR